MPLATQTITRNLLSQVVVLSSDPKGTDVIEWKAKDDPGGDDYQVVPESILGLPAFTRLLSKGIVEIVQADEATKKALDAQAAAFHARLNGAAAKAQDVLDPEAKNDFLMVPCIGPDSRGTGLCGTEVSVREKIKDDAPALCSTHKPLAGQYIQSEEQDGTAVVKKWSRMIVTAPERQQV